VNKDAGRFYLLQRDVEKATRCYEKAVEVMETDFHAWAMLSTCYLASGDKKKLAEAARMMVSESEKAVQQDPSNGAALGILAGGHALLGDEERSREWIDRALLIDPDNLTMRYNFACILSGVLGDTDGAIKVLETTLSLAGAHQVRVADTDTDLDAIRGDPRFQKMMAAAKKRHGIEDASLTAPAQAAE
jgi:adenylate cyclase